MGRNTDVLGRALWRDKGTLGRLELRAGMWMAGGTARCLAEGVVEHQQQKERLKERQEVTSPVWGPQRPLCVERALEAPEGGWLLRSEMPAYPISTASLYTYRAPLYPGS